jgi:hypothetical protein
VNQRYLVRVGARFLARAARSRVGQSEGPPLLTDYVTATGAFVRTDAPAQAMELRTIEFVLPPDGARDGSVVLHGMVTRRVPPRTLDIAPGVEIAFFAKGGDASAAWDRFIAYLGEVHPESRREPIVLARGATDQVRRAHRRLVPRSRFRIEGEGARSFTVGDVSAGGMFLTTDDDSLPVGSDLRLTLVPPRSSERVAIDCVVRRRGSGGKRGIGVEFRNLDTPQRRALKDVMHAAGAVPPGPDFEKQDGGSVIDSKGENAGVLPARRLIDSKGENAGVLSARRLIGARPA